jgi:hypothetical protein
MTPKEKAKELIHKFYPNVQWKLGQEDCLQRAKNCALIAVKFARQEFRDHCAAEIGTDGSPDDHFDVLKQEIENYEL